VMWPFVPYTASNGTTLLWPGSHRRQDEILIDPAEAIIAEMEPGSALLFLGSTLHCGNANSSSASRRGMIVSYALRWLKPYELPWLAYPPALARTFPRELAALAGYRAHRPNLGTYEGRCPSALLGDTPDLWSEAIIDTLRPEQGALIAAYRNGDIRQRRKDRSRRQRTQGKYLRYPDFRTHTCRVSIRFRYTRAIGCASSPDHRPGQA
jgi:Phytanoyl-CoA dioxygenase (PhyH)